MGVPFGEILFFRYLRKPHHAISAGPGLKGFVRFSPGGNVIGFFQPRQRTRIPP
jgi:hypothetical protein